MITKQHKSIAAFIHLSTFSRFIFPFGNFIGPIILWMTNKDKSEFIDTHAKDAINFQISMLLYSFIIGAISIPIFIYGFFSGFEIENIQDFENLNFDTETLTTLILIAIALLFIAIICFIIELVLVVIASIKAKDGYYYKYPLTITFLK